MSGRLARSGARVGGRPAGPSRHVVPWAALLCATLLAAPAAAHPLGNFSISQYSGIALERDAIVVRYLVDLAEIPTFQEVQDNAIVAEHGHPTLGPYLARRADALKSGLRLDVDGRRHELVTVSREILVTPGAGGLPTIKLGAVYRATLSSADTVAHVSYRDGNFSERVGWKEIVATAGDGVTLVTSSVPATDRSRELSDYPSDLLNSPPQVLEARLAFAVAGPPHAWRGTERAAHAAEASPPGPASAMPHTGLGARDSAPSTVSRILTGRDGWGSAVRLPISGDGRDSAVSLADSGRSTRSQPVIRSEACDTEAAADGGALALSPASGGTSDTGRAGEAASALGPAADQTAVSGALAGAGASLAASQRVGLRPNRQAGVRDPLSDLVGRSGGGLGVVLLAGLAAIVLGGFHALEPGHGKTVVAAYLVGARGTARHALLLGLTVTASHTAGVFLLGTVTLYASHAIVPERLYPWLGALSGLTIAGLGIVLFLRRYAAGATRHGDTVHGGYAHEHGHTHARERPHGRAHEPGDAHEHGDIDGHRHSPGDAHHHGFGGGHQHHVPSGVSLRELVALGVSGGIVPCPGALVVLLAAVALGRIGFGLFLIVAFSVGLAAVLVAVGLLMVYARRLMANRHVEGPLITRWLPLTSSAVMAALGLAIAVQALAAAGVVAIRLG